MRRGVQIDGVIIVLSQTKRSGFETAEMFIGIIHVKYIGIVIMKGYKYTLIQIFFIQIS